MIFAGREDATSLGLVRALVVGILTLNLLSQVGAVAEYYSDESPLAARYARMAAPDRISVFLPRPLPEAEATRFYATSDWAVRGIFALGAVCHVLWLLGLYTRAAGFVSFGLWVSLWGRNPLLFAYPDQLGMSLAFLLVLMPCGRGFSLDARWRGRGGPVPVWCRWILQLQLVVVYTATGLLKSGPIWGRDGTALYYALVNPYFARFDLAPVYAALQPWLLRPMTWAVLIWERAFVLFGIAHWIREWSARAGRESRWVPELRPVFLGFGALMHLGIALALNVGWFSPMIVLAYACFLRPPEARWLIARVRARFESAEEG